MIKFGVYTVSIFLAWIFPPVTPTLKQVPRCDVPDADFTYSKTSPENLARTGRLAVFEKGQLWTNSTVHFVIDQERLNDRQIGMIYQAFMEFHAKTCIRFKPWSPSKGPNYINITSTENGACSLSEVCMKGGQQLVQLGGPCWFKGMVVHQLGHALCLGHEHQRPIRDQYLSYKRSCPDSEIPSKLGDDEGQLGFYDYASQMHFGCGWCGGGWPTDGNYTKCGYQITDGLSLLDADYLNLLYSCKSCHRHRWVPLEKMLPENVRHMPDFGYKDQLGDSLYPCRVSFGGEIIIGKFTWRHKACSFSLAGKEHYKNGVGIEILLIPGGLKDSRSEYKLEDNTMDPQERQLTSVAVPAGRVTETEDYGLGYVAFAKLRSQLNWEYEDVIGKAWEKNGRIPYAYFPLGGEEVGAYYFKVLTCYEKSKV